ncbi:protein phosphatase regulator BUD14 [Sporobolomyces koalae]|uniref:protein phosphatase regulator BUD14 n=1 Tax=Sporobolomyces koalae TaxID=500713 RepID=UPI0031801A7C
MPSYGDIQSSLQHQGPTSLHASPRQSRKPGISYNSQGARHESVEQMQMQSHHGYRDPAPYGYREAQNQAMDILEGEESPVEGADSGDEVEEALHNARQYHHHHHHDLQGEQGLDHDHDHDGEEGEEEDLEDDSGSFSDSLSSSPSIPDEDIDFNLVYALHTFLATVDGQASVVKGDQLLLLDDSNSYWWLVRVLKTQAIGYIPAENIETPWERLARLNKHRNVDLTSATQQDVVTGPTSSTAQTRFADRIPPSQQPHPHASQHPTAKGIIASPSHKDHPRNMSPVERAGSSKAKTVLFTAPTYYAHSATGETEDEYDEDGDEYDEEMLDHQHDGEGVEYDDEVDEHAMHRHDYQEDQHHNHLHHSTDMHPDGSEFSDDGEVEHGTPILEEDRRGAPAAGAATRRTSLYGSNDLRTVEDDGHLGGDEDDEEQEKQSHWEKEREHAIAAQQQAAMAEAQWARDREQQARRALSPEHQAPGQTFSNDFRQPTDGTLSTSTSSSSVRRPIDENGFNPNVPTKKLTATPSIVRDPTFDFENPHDDQSTASQPRSDQIKTSSPTAGTPTRVRGVEIVDPRDPKFSRMLQPTLKAGEETLYEHVSKRSVDSSNGGYGAPGPEGDMSFASLETVTTASSLQSNGSSNEIVNGTSALSKKQKRQSGEAADGDKKRKSGGILGLFRKKDKKKKGGKDEEGVEPRSSEDSARRNGTASPSSPRSSAERGGSTPSKRDSVTVESLFSTDATLRQQELEAKQALYHQYGVHRGPGDITNTMAPRPAPISVSMTNSGSRNSLQLPNPGAASGSQSPSYAGSGQRIRPGSLMGSPSIPGLDVPLLSVLRVFAGEHVEAESTFKTVLLNQSTTSADLVKQAMQRFRLTGYDINEEFYLTVKELGGDERPLQDGERPLEIFEELSEKAGAGSSFAVPSVKRSSIGSINSISSNLSLNPAITRLGMNDWSDDSAVKFYLNRQTSSSANRSVDAASTDPTSLADREPLRNESLAPTAAASSNSQTSYRFAVRLLIHPSDLPENVVFDPQSNAIIPKQVLHERQQRNGVSDHSEEVSPNARERIVFFPKNANVSDVIEAGLDRFGIVDGVVDGGDEVEDRVSKRRSISRVKYTLAVERDGKETTLNASTKLLDAYSTPPAFKPYDRSSKEFKRRSVDATLILGSSGDIQETDPVFIIRRSAHRGPSKGYAGGPLPAKIDELDELRQQRSKESGQQGDPSSTPASQRDIIAAQRAASRANQRAILSAQKNSDKGIDINIPDQGTIRSARVDDDDVRYSFINNDGTETDISDIVENEWRSAQGRSQPRSQLDVQQSQSGRPGSRASSKLTVGAASGTDAESFQTAPQTPLEEKRALEDPSAGEDNEDEEAAINAVTASRIDIDLAGSGPYRRAGLDNTPAPDSFRQAEPPATQPTTGPEGGDILQDALGPRPVTSPVFNESLQERLDRVLAKVKEDKLRRAASPSGSIGRPRSYMAGSATPSGRASPAVLSGRLSPLNTSDRRSPATLHSGRLSPLGGRDSPTIDQIINQSPRSQSNASRQGHHGKKASIASVSSVLSSGTDQPSTPVTVNSSSSNGRAPSGASFTPASSATSNHRRAIVYPAEFGFDTLVTIVNAAEDSPRLARGTDDRDPAREALFGRDLSNLDVSPEVHQLYEARFKRLNELESRLDAVLLRIQKPSRPADT